MKKTTSKTTASEEVVKMSEATCSDKCESKCKIDKLTVVFQSEDMNKVVEKINEIIESK